MENQLGKVGGVVCAYLIHFKDNQKGITAEFSKAHKLGYWGGSKTLFEAKNISRYFKKLTDESKSGLNYITLLGEVSNKNAKFYSINTPFFYWDSILDKKNPRTAYSKSAVNVNPSCLLHVIGVIKQVSSNQQEVIKYLNKSKKWDHKKVIFYFYNLVQDIYYLKKGINIRINLPLEQNKIELIQINEVYFETVLEFIRNNQFFEESKKYVPEIAKTNQLFQTTKYFPQAYVQSGMLMPQILLSMSKEMIKSMDPKFLRELDLGALNTIGPIFLNDNFENWQTKINPMHVEYLLEDEKWKNYFSKKK
jgi:hypothetical protein